MMQMKKYLTYVQQKNMKVSDYKDSIRVQFDTTLAQTGELPYGMSTLKMVIEEDTAVKPWATDKLDWRIKFTDEKERNRLLKKAYDFNMALIYFLGCNSNEMRMDFAKAFGNGHDNYPCTLEEMCNIHWTIYHKPTKRKKSGNNDHNLNNDDMDDDDNNKKEDKNEDEVNLVTAHIAGFDQMSGFEQMSALIDEGHGYHDMDDGFNNDIIGLHADDVDDSYELSNVPTDKPKTTKSEQSEELESDDPDIMTAEAEDSIESIPFISKKRIKLSAITKMPTKTFLNPNWVFVNTIF